LKYVFELLAWIGSEFFARTLIFSNLTIDNYATFELTTVGCLAGCLSLN